VKAQVFWSAFSWLGACHNDASFPTNAYRDAEAIAEAVQRPTMNFVALKTPEQMDLLALHRVRSRLVRTGVINQIRGFLIERGITVRQGLVCAS
jgi:transposase